MNYASTSEKTNRFVTIDNVRVPRFLYGTAWKEGRTESLATLALGMGFRGIDTANQRKHYVEAAVGKAVTGAVERGMLNREQIFLQTKFTHVRGQDHRLPYDASAPIPEQVRQSFTRSLEHLGVERIDSYVLHGPTARDGLANADWAAWRAMEQLYKEGGTRFLGISNVSLAQLKTLCDSADVQPRFVQNRCYASRAWDRPMRDFCAQNGIVYQGFSLLTANRQLTTHSEMISIAKRYGRDISEIIFRFALDVDMIALTGTSDAKHMRTDLDIFAFQLDPTDVERIENLGVS
ncbi:MAG: aldo/keto reductase [Rhodospirillaceae bacterium]|jgi:diketogulonate reductase-like aldo/keto reductase|nr:aldo/keto reductase [Rhodospirillaceae bacterium]